MTARSLAFSLVAAASLYPLSATAAPILVEAVPTAKVSFADLDLTAEAGKASLSRRIAAAAKQVCGTPSARELNTILARERCRKNAVASANMQVERLVATRLAKAGRNVEVAGTH